MKNSLKTFWEKDATTHMNYAYQYGKNPMVRYPMYEVRRDLVFKTLDTLTPKGKLLDAGCGAAHILCECLEKGWDCFGFDFSDNMVELSKINLEKLGHDTKRVRNGLMSDLSAYENNSFNVVLILGVSQYLMEDDDLKIWSEIRRVLMPDGIVLVDFVNGLFDLLTFNKFTLDFISNEVLPIFFSTSQQLLLKEKIAKLLTYPNKPDVKGLYSTRRDHIRKRTENPLTLSDRMQQHGFVISDNRFFRFHAVPPLLFENDPDLEKVAISSEGILANHWIGHFIASAFLVTLKKS
jgi:ubiquinone/menaquinone biosynthesis C-methylase UbiE